VNLIQVHRVGWDALSPIKLFDDPFDLVKFDSCKTDQGNQYPTDGRNIYDDQGLTSGCRYDVHKKCKN